MYFLLTVAGSGRTEILSALFQDRSISPRPSSTIPEKSSESNCDGSREIRSDKDEANDRAIADVLLAADFEDEMEDVGEDAFEEMFDDDNKIYADNIDEPNRNLVAKPKRKMELKAGLLKEILFNKPKRHTFSGLYM